MAAQMKVELSEEYAREEAVYNSTSQSIATAGEKLKGIDAKIMEEQAKATAEMEEAKNECHDMTQETNEMKDRFKELTEFYKNTASTAEANIKKLEVFIEKQREKEKQIKVSTFLGIEYSDKATTRVPGREREANRGIPARFAITESHVYCL